MRRRKNRRWLLWWLGRGGIAIIALLALAAAGGFFWLRHSLPDYDGTAALAGLTAEVKVARDLDGVPSIFANDLPDAYRALGFVHAQDRFFQMEMTRRVGAGRLSEVLGEATLRFDRLMRTLDFYRLAEQSVALMEPAARAAVDAYAEGVNAWLATEPALPPEFLLLRAAPEPWVPADSVVWGRLMAFQLSNNMSDELLRARMAETLTPEQIGDLWAQNPPGSAETMTDLAAVMQNLPLRALADTLSAIQAPASASNEWVVSGAQSETGMPLLANDPHLGFGAPGLWYLARIVTPEAEIVGATVPGVPLTVVGHNRRIAWGFTTTHADTQDIFVERIDPDDAANYLTEKGSVPFVTREELITVRGRDEPEKLLVRATRNGPVISDVSRSAEKATPEDHVLSLAFAALSPQDRTAEGLYRLNQAQDWSEFVAAMRLFHAPMQNIAYADTSGNIGFYAPARLPIRRAGDGRLPAEGWTGENAWDGFVPFRDLPQAFNPPTGRIVNANNRLVRDGGKPFVAADWPASYRADRITTLLAARPKHDANSFASIQTDAKTLLARTMLPTLLENSAPIDDIRSHEILGQLSGWSGEMDRRRPEPLIFMAWLDALGRRLFADELGELADDFQQLRPRTLEHILSNRPQWCDDVTTEGSENCQAQIIAAFADALTFLSDRQGKNWRKWRWGDLHQAQFSHQMFGRIPLLRRLSDTSIPSDGGGFTINRGVYLSGNGDDAFSHIVGAGYRAIYDLSDLSRSRFMIATGQSGHFLSPLYGNLTQRWRAGEYLTIAGQKEDNPTATLVLRPAQP